MISGHVVHAIPAKQKQTIGMYIKEVGIEYKIEIALHDSFQEILDKNFHQKLKPDKNNSFYRMGKYSLY